MKKWTVEKILIHFLDNIQNDTLQVRKQAIKDLFSNPAKSDCDKIYLTLRSMSGDGLISILTASGCEDTYNIFAIRITERGAGLLERKKQERKDFRRNFRYNMAVAVVSALIGALCGWGLSWLSFVPK